jgi:hypothetical protein
VNRKRLFYHFSKCCVEKRGWWIFQLFCGFIFRDEWEYFVVNVFAVLRIKKKTFYKLRE